MRSTAELVAALLAFPGQETGDLQALDALVTAAVSQPPADDLDRALFGVFERFPGEDGHGVYWGIVHGLEGRGGYEESLLASVRRSPSPFALLMLNRLCNAGQMECAGVPIVSLLEEVASSDAAPGIRQEAVEFLEYQRKRPSES
jgi:hypothetical protein